MGNDMSKYSEPVQEIMGIVPSWITRWGVTVIFFVLLFIIIGCCLIRYPQTVRATISVTSTCPPSELAARFDGLIDDIYIDDGQEVHAGELIALISTPAKYNDIKKIENFLMLADTADISMVAYLPVLDSSLVLGDLQAQWSSLQKAFRNYKYYLDVDHTNVKKNMLNKQIAGYEVHYATMKRQKYLLDSELKIEYRSLERDSLLYQRQAISAVEYENTRKGYLSKLNTATGFDASLEATALDILQLEQQVVELDLLRDSEISGYESNIRQEIQALNALVDSWMETYAIVSSSDGFVSLHDYWSAGQHVCVGDVVANVLPKEPYEIIGRMKVSSVGFGKVKMGQLVNVRLNGFPYMEYGILKGQISSIASVPEILSDGSASYTVAVDFPNGFISTYGKEFPLIQQMDGDAMIVIRERRIIEVFIEPLFSLFINR